jgi:hypothetical protein
MECVIGYVHDFCGLNVEKDMFRHCKARNVSCV